LNGPVTGLEGVSDQDKPGFCLISALNFRAFDCQHANINAMSLSETRAVRRSPIIQFSVFSENKVGILSEIIGMLAAQNVHVMALSTIDTVDSSLLRVIVDDPDRARDLFRLNGYTHIESRMLGVEMKSEEDLRAVLAALLEAEVNIHFLYPFVSRPNGRCGLALFVDDRELAEDSLTLRGMTVIDQNDISR